MERCIVPLTTPSPVVVAGPAVPTIRTVGLTPYAQTCAVGPRTRHHDHAIHVLNVPKPHHREPALSTRAVQVDLHAPAVLEHHLGTVELDRTAHHLEIQ